MYTYTQLAQSEAPPAKTAPSSHAASNQAAEHQAASPPAAASPEKQDAAPHQEAGPWSRAAADMRKKQIVASVTSSQETEEHEEEPPKNDAQVDVWNDPSVKLVPMQLRIFYKNTVYWISARVHPALAWISLLELLITALNDRHGLRLPPTPYQYTFYNMDTGALLKPLDNIRSMLADEILFIHKSEFSNAYDHVRRARIVSDVLQDPNKRFAQHDMEVVLTF